VTRDSNGPATLAISVGASLLEPKELGFALLKCTLNVKNVNPFTQKDESLPRKTKVFVALHKEYFVIITLAVLIGHEHNL